MGDLAGLVALGAVLRQQNILDQGLAVLAVENGKSRLQSQGLALLAQNPQPKLVESADSESFGGLGRDQLADPLAHLPGCLVGKRHRGDIASADAAVLDQVGDLAGDHTGLAGAGAGQHQQRAVDIRHRLGLPGIESGVCLGHCSGTAKRRSILAARPYPIPL